MYIDGKLCVPAWDTNARYFVSMDGCVYSMKSKSWLKQSMRVGYPYVDINYLDGKGQRHVKVHRLVYESWNGKIPDGMQINHTDDNPLNNHIDNLYCGTQSENIRDCIRNDHRVGRLMAFVVYDSVSNTARMFYSKLSMLKYTGAPDYCLRNCQYPKAKAWYARWAILISEPVSTKERYNLLKTYCGKSGVEISLEISGEASTVQEILSLLEARGELNCSKR